MLKNKMIKTIYCDEGFTLVEILVSLVILLLIITATFPLLSMATKITYENRAKLIASELAKQELERIMSLITATNYISEADDAPLQTGIFEYYFQDDGTPYLDASGNFSTTHDPNSRFAQYKARKIVGWVDDPADGLHPDDILPFDYKFLTVEITSPSAFSGTVSKKADFKAFIAREGAISPLTGIIVKVVRGWTDENGKRIPIEGVTVNLNGIDSSPNVSAQTNQDGEALIPFIFPDEKTKYSYDIELDYPAMMPRPGQISTADALPNTASRIQMEMEYPATINVHLEPALNAADVTLEGTEESLTKTLAAGKTSVSFDNLWPTGTNLDNPLESCDGSNYSIKIAPRLIYQLSLGEEEGQWNEEKFDYHLPSIDEDDNNSSVKNLWLYHKDINNSETTWQASKTNYDEDVLYHNDENGHRIATTNMIDLSRYKAQNGAAITDLKANFSSGILGYPQIQATSPYAVVQMGKNSAKIDSDIGWEPFLLISRKNNKNVLQDAAGNTVATEVNSAINNPTNIAFPNNFSYLSQPFFLRFNSNPLWNNFSFTWSKLDIFCAYEKSGIDFEEPGARLELYINK